VSNLEIRGAARATCLEVIENRGETLVSKIFGQRVSNGWPPISRTLPLASNHDGLASVASSSGTNQTDAENRRVPQCPPVFGSS